MSSDEGGFSGREVRDYYRTLAPYLDRASLDRGDEAFWRWVAATRPDSVLELGAGTGRVTRFLARGSREIVALDLSLEMLRRARWKLTEAPHVRLLVADFRHPPLSRRFDLVVAANDPLAHLVTDADRALAFRAVARRLRPGGRFILDALWLPPEELKRGARHAGSTWEREPHQPADTTEGDFRVREVWSCEEEGGACRVRYTYLKGERVLAEAETDLRPWTPDDLCSRLQVAGLRPVNVWGDYQRTGWRTDLARALVVEAVRP